MGWQTLCLFVVFSHYSLELNRSSMAVDESSDSELGSSLCFPEECGATTEDGFGRKRLTRNSECESGHSLGCARISTIKS